MSPTPTNGYQYHPMVRVTPDDGLPRVWDLREEFSDCNGQSRTRVRPMYEVEKYKDVNRRSRQTKFGLRLRVRLTFLIARTVDHSALAQIVTSCMQDNETVELSLDGGFLYREVNMTRAPEPKPFGGKTIAGAKHEIRFETVKLVDRMTAMTYEGAW